MFYVRSSVRHSVCVRKLALIPAAITQNVIKDSCLVCVKSEKQPFLVTFLAPRSMRRGKAELHILKITSLQMQI